MTTRRLIAVGVLLPVFIAGCAGPVKSRDYVPTIEDTSTPKSTGAAEGQPKTPGGPAVAEPAQPARPGDRMDANAGTADALAAKSESYARELAAMIQARQNASQPQSVPSKVEWVENPFPVSSDLRLGSEPQARPAAAVQQAGFTQADDEPATVNPPAPNPASPTLRVQAPGANPQPPPAQVALADVSERPISISPPTTDPILQRTEARLKDSPRDVWLHTEYQILRLLRDEPTPEMNALASLPQEDREVVTALVDGLANFRSSLRQDSNMLLSSKIRPIVDMADRLRQQSELTIPTLVLCTKVEKFGVYDPIEPSRFPADRENQAIVYVEVANFMSSLTAGQTWTTQIKWDMTLFTDQGVPVWSEKTQEVEDAARTKRRDFFVRKVVTFPRTLTIGRYLLKVTIIDKQSNHVAEATAPLVIAAQ